MQNIQKEAKANRGTNPCKLEIAFTSTLSLSVFAYVYSKQSLFSPNMERGSNRSWSRVPEQKEIQTKGFGF